MKRRGVVLAGLRAHAGLLAACSLLLLVGGVVLTALVVNVSLTTTQGVRERLLDLPASDRLVELSVESAEDGVSARELAGRVRGERERAVADDVERSLGAAGVPYAVHVSARTGLIHVLSDAEPAPRLVGFAYRDLTRHAILVDGHWPQRGDGTGGSGVPVAVHAGAATALGVDVGDGIAVELAGAPASLEVVGIWRPRDPADPYFGGQSLEVDGADGPSTFGPVVPADPAVLGQVDLRWRVVPAAEALTAGDLPALDAALGRLATFVRQDPRLADPDVTDALRPHVAALDAQSVTASSVGAVPVVVVAVLLAAGLVLTAGLLVDRRTGSVRVIRARGASGGQVARWAAAETLLLAVPALTLAAPVGWVVLRVTGTAGADRWVPPTRAWQVAVAAGLAGGTVLLGTSLATARQGQSRAGATATGRRRAATRAGLELVLLALAAIAVRQLRRYSGTTTTVLTGDLATDPVLVAAPALALLAGSVLVTRLVPVGAGVAARWWARRPGAPLALTGWETARRPAAHAPTVLLLSLAVGAGVLASGYSSTWRGEQLRTAAAQVGADMQVTMTAEPPAPGGDAATRAAAFAAVDGVSAAASLLVEDTTVGPTQVTLVAADANGLKSLGGAAGAGVATAAGALAGPSAGALPGVVLPARTRSLAVDLTASVAVAEVAPDVAAFGPGFPVTAGTPVRRLASRLWLAASDGQAVAVTVPEVGVTAGATVATTEHVEVPAPEGSWRIVALDLTDPGSTFGGPADTTVVLQVDGIWAGQGSATVVVDPAASWSGDGGPRWRAAAVTPSSGSTAAAVDGEWPGASIAVPAFAPGQSRARVLAGPPLTGALPAVITRDLAAANALSKGSRITVQHRGRPVVASVVGVVDDLPGPGGPTVLVDLGALTAVDLSRGFAPGEASRWWLVLDGDTRQDDVLRGAVVDRVAEVGGDGSVVSDRVQVARRLAGIPPASAVPGVLLAGAAAALALATIGLVVATAASTGRRSVESAVLHVLGLSRSQARRMAVGHAAGIGVLAVAAGGVIGWAAAVLTLPALVLTPGTGGGTGRAHVSFDLGPVLTVVAAGLVLVLLVGGVRAVVGAVPTRRAASLRRAALAIRLGEDL